MPPTGAVALVAHEQREAKVDAKLDKALKAAGLEVQPLSPPPALHQVEADEASRKRLQLWRIPLSIASD